MTTFADAEEPPLELAPPYLGAPSRASIRVRIASPHRPVLQQVRAMLAGVRGMMVLTEARVHADAFGRSAVPDIVIAELASRDIAPRTTIRELLRGEAGLHVLLMSARRDTEWMRAAFDAGAAGVVPANASREALIVAVRAVASGQVVLPRRAFTAMVAQPSARDFRDDGREPASRSTGLGRAGHGLARLTARERSVFRMIAEGYSAPEVGAQLSISKKTVETYKRRIGEKLGLSHRADYVRFALESEGLVAPRLLTAG